jgi:hypothetical protein
MTYRTRGGREEIFEGYFNRYNMFYRGYTLPGGRTAETVYLSLNDPYYSLINGGTPRPLDFRYLRSLPPTAQRFYEIVSTKIFAAITNGYPSAWIRYSDFCLLAAQRRLETRRRMQIQMAAVHRPHVASGYLAGVSWRPERTADGAPDWTIHYVPGPRAHAEFEAFNGRRRIWRRTGPIPTKAAGPARSATVLPTVKRRETTPAEPSLASLLARRFFEMRTGTTSVLVTETQHRRAQEVLDRCEGDYDLAIAAIDLAATAVPNGRPGFPDHLGGVLEGGFVERARAAGEEEARRRQATEQRAREHARRDRYDSWCRQRVADRIARLSAEERRRIVEERLAQFTESFRSYFELRSWTGERASEWAEPKILKRYGHEGEASFEEWCRLHDAEATGTSGPDEALQ